MAVTKAPLFSMDASGQVAKSIVFSRWKGRPYVRQLVVPSNPKTGLQTGVRAMMRFLTQAYASLSSGEKQAWADRALIDNITALNADVQYNMPIMRQNKGIWTDPANTPGTPPGAPTSPGATAQVKSVVLAWTNSVTGTPYATFIYRSLTGTFTEDPSNLIAIVPAADETYTDIGLSTGTQYFYSMKHSDDSGQLGTGSTEVNATPT